MIEQLGSVFKLTPFFCSLLFSVPKDVCVYNMIEYQVPANSKLHFSTTNNHEPMKTPADKLIYPLMLLNVDSSLETGSQFQ